MSSINSFVAPLAGASEGRLVLTRGGTGITIRGAAIDDLCCVTSEGVRMRITARDGCVEIEYPRLTGAGVLGRSPARRVEIEVSMAVRWAIAVNGTLSHSDVDLRGVNLRALEFASGPNEVEVLLPVPRGRVSVHLGFGAGDVALLRPPAVAAQLMITGGASGLTFDGSYLEALSGSGHLETPNAAAVDDRFEIDMLGRSGQITVAERLTGAEARSGLREEESGARTGRMPWGLDRDSLHE